MTFPACAVLVTKPPSSTTTLVPPSSIIAEPWCSPSRREDPTTSVSSRQAPIETRRPARSSVATIPSGAPITQTTSKQAQSTPIRRKAKSLDAFGWPVHATDDHDGGHKRENPVTLEIMVPRPQFVSIGWIVGNLFTCCLLSAIAAGGDSRIVHVGGVDGGPRRATSGPSSTIPNSETTNSAGTTTTTDRSFVVVQDQLLPHKKVTTIDDQLRSLQAATNDSSNIVTTNSSDGVVIGEFRRLCRSEKKGANQYSSNDLSLFDCACNESQLSIACERRSPAPVEETNSRWVMTQNYTQWFEYNAKYNLMESRQWQVCYEYRYNASSTSSAESLSPPSTNGTGIIPPRGCVDFVVTDGPSGFWNCTATLSDPQNGSLGNCKSCLACGSQAAEIDCRNINALAATTNLPDIQDWCYDLDPYRMTTNNLFANVVVPTSGGTSTGSGWGGGRGVAVVVTVVAVAVVQMMW